MDRKTVETYNKMALQYDEETRDFWDNFPFSFLKEFIKLAKGNVLDIGSGPGRDGLILKENGFQVTCLDASEEMIKISTERGLDSVLGDFLNLPFEKNTFDSAWAYTSLLHIPKKDIRKAFLEIHRVLKGTGILGLGFIDGDFEGYRESSGIDLPRYFCFYKKEELEEIFKENGFDIIYFESFVPRSKTYLNFILRKSDK